MGGRVLITGGAGFIGSHLADELLRCGHAVRVLDDLTPQLHGRGLRRPPHLDPEVELCIGDIREPETIREALADVEAVIHLAARVGVRQSMYRVEEYMSVNSVGTAVLFEELIRHPVARLVVGSSMSVYGEGLSRTLAGELVEGQRRSLGQLRRGNWELAAPNGEPLSPVATPETKSPALESVYSLSKYDQERLCLMLGRAYDVPTVVLRLFNVYGPRQALSNPYTGMLAIFAARLLRQAGPVIAEDGLQSRDFVSVHDVARAFVLALESRAAVGRVLNVGSGCARTAKDVARSMAVALGVREIEAEVTGKYRVGEVRHCFADISAAAQCLGYQPAVVFDEGIDELARWLEQQVASDAVYEARAELEARGVTL